MIPLPLKQHPRLALFWTPQLWVPAQDPLSHAYRQTYKIFYQICKAGCANSRDCHISHNTSIYQ